MTYNSLFCIFNSFQNEFLSKIWRSHPTLQALRARRAIPMAQVRGCEVCEWNSYCNGGCPGLAYELTGNFNRANPDGCYRRFLEQMGELTQIERSET